MMRDFPISLAYVKNPKVPSKSQLKLNRRKEIENETIKYQKLLYEGKHKDEIERLTERELGRINHLRQRNSDFLEKRASRRTGQRSCLRRSGPPKQPWKSLRNVRSSKVAFTWASYRSTRRRVFQCFPWLMRVTRDRKVRKKFNPP